MNKRILMSVVWGLVFCFCIHIICSALLFIIEFACAAVLSESDTSEIPWLSALYTVFIYVPWVFMLLGCFLGFQGVLPGTRFPKEVEIDPLIRVGTNEAEYASLVLRQRNEKPTYSNQLRQNTKTYLLLFGLVVIGVFVAYMYKQSWLYFLVCGSAIGFLWRDSIFMFQTKIVHAFRIKIIDWKKVSEIASKAERTVGEEDK